MPSIATTADAARWSTRTYAAVDEDRDGFGVAKSGQICAGAQLPAGLISTLPATEDLDCDDADVDKWRLLRFASRDQDRDGYAIADKGTVCGQGTLPADVSVQSTPPQLADLRRHRCQPLARRADLSRRRWGWFRQRFSEPGVYRHRAAHWLCARWLRRPITIRNDPLAVTISTLHLDSRVVDCA